MIAVDTNVLVYAHVESFAKHEAAKQTLRALAEGVRPWGIPAPCLAEFLRIVTHPRVLEDPYSVNEAVEAMRSLLASPTVSVLCPAHEHWSFLEQAMIAGDARGNLAFDAAIVALCRELGVSALITEDRDFDRFPDLPVRRLG